MDYDGAPFRSNLGVWHAAIRERAEALSRDHPRLFDRRWTLPDTEAASVAELRRLEALDVELRLADLAQREEALDAEMRKLLVHRRGSEGDERSFPWAFGCVATVVGALLIASIFTVAGSCLLAFVEPGLGCAFGSMAILCIAVIAALRPTRPARRPVDVARTEAHGRLATLVAELAEVRANAARLKTATRVAPSGASDAEPDEPLPHAPAPAAHLGGATSGHAEAAAGPAGPPAPRPREGGVAGE